jgi:DNA-directed RNA polymerase subunit K/omega
MSSAGKIIEINTDDLLPKTKPKKDELDSSSDDEIVSVNGSSVGSDDDANSSVSGDSNTQGETSDEEGDEDESDAADEGDEDAAGAGAGAEGGEGGEDEAGDDDAGARKKQKKASAKKRASAKKQTNTEDDLTLLGVPHGLTFDDDDDEDEDESDAEHADEEYFQKMKTDVRQNFAEIYHPESFSNNYDEIQTLSKVIRNSAGIIIDDLHRTIPFMTKYEKTRILGQRAKQLNEGANPLIKIDSTVIDGYLIAVKELEQKRTPFIIRRPLPNGGSEYWRIQDLEII